MPSSSFLRLITLREEPLFSPRTSKPGKYLIYFGVCLVATVLLAPKFLRRHHPPLVSFHLLLITCAKWLHHLIATPILDYNVTAGKHAHTHVGSVSRMKTCLVFCWFYLLPASLESGTFSNFNGVEIATILLFFMEKPVWKWTVKCIDITTFRDYTFF